MGSLVFAKDGGRQEHLRHQQSAGSRGRALLRGSRVFHLDARNHQSMASGPGTHEPVDLSCGRECLPPAIKEWLAGLSACERFHATESIAAHVRAIDAAQEELEDPLDQRSAALLAVFIEYALAHGLSPAELMWMWEADDSAAEPNPEVIIESSIDRMLADASMRLGFAGTTDESENELSGDENSRVG